MKKTKSFLYASAFMASTLSVNAGGLCEEIEFTESLTNETDWVYSDVDFLQSGEMQIRESAAYVISKEFPFTITSVSVTANKATDAGTRNLIITPIYADGTEGVAVDITPSSSTAASITTEWPATDQIRSFRLGSNNGKGNITILSAAISGVAPLETPYGLLSSEIYRDGFTASWTASAAATSNRVEVFEIVDEPFSANYTTNYPLSALVNSGGRTKDISDEIAGLLPEFEGFKIVLPPKTNGVIQIGTTDTPGILVLPAQDSYASLKLVIHAEYQDNDPSHEEMPVKYIAGGTTNDFAEIEVNNFYEFHVLNLDNIPGGAQIAMSSPEHNDRRFKIDLLGFATETTAAYTATNTVDSGFSASSKFKVDGLGSNSTYYWRVTSFGTDGAASAPSELQSVTTNDKRRPKPGLRIKIR